MSIIWLGLISVPALMYSVNIFSDLLIYKVDNIIGLFSNLEADSIYYIPHSPQVRVIELINIFSYPFHKILFGHGIGGYFSDIYFPFNDYIGTFDFSSEEIIMRKFYNPHNIAFGLLKFGMIWWIFLFSCFINAYKCKNKELRIVLAVCLLVLGLNFGYAIKTSILLGLMLVFLGSRNQNYKVSSVETES